jgi:hypothetical protein
MINFITADFKMQTAYKWDEERKEWIGLVVQYLEGSQTVRDVGSEPTKALIEDWCNRAGEAYANDPLNDHHIPDMYDRKVTQ